MSGPQPGDAEHPRLVQRCEAAGGDDRPQEVDHCDLADRRLLAALLGQHGHGPWHDAGGDELPTHRPQRERGPLAAVILSEVDKGCFLLGAPTHGLYDAAHELAHLPRIKQQQHRVVAVFSDRSRRTCHKQRRLGDVQGAARPDGVGVVHAALGGADVVHEELPCSDGGVRPVEGAPRERGEHSATASAPLEHQRDGARGRAVLDTVGRLRAAEHEIGRALLNLHGAAHEVRDVEWAREVVHPVTRGVEAHPAAPRQTFGGVELSKGPVQRLREHDDAAGGEATERQHAGLGALAEDLQLACPPAS
mmetsp:Transcript_150472/g.483643  ORF Transcript_150472/g.483643 Transcript_150472/m.483643 type:complete len:306 (-) Transcript_150472:6544-7461(-)